jgi:hypothetical protein
LSAKIKRYEEIKKKIEKEKKKRRKKNRNGPGATIRPRTEASLQPC